MRTEIRRTPGGWVPNGEKVSVWGCETCNFHGGYAVGRAFDGTEGSWCPVCNGKGAKNPMVTIQIDDLDHVRGSTEVKCCGHWLDCGRFTNTCNACGADYNSAGQLLAPREQWGEETGEHWTECV